MVKEVQLETTRGRNWPKWAVKNLVFFVAGTVGFHFIAAVLLLIFGRGRDKMKDLSGKELQQVRKKVKMMEKSASRSGGPRGSKHGLPPGQNLSKTWIVLDLGKQPTKEQYKLNSDWSMKFAYGKQTADLRLCDLTDHLREFEMDWHCVTGWTYKGLQFRGLMFNDLLSLLSTKFAFHLDDSWSFIFQSSSEGYGVPVFRDDLEEAFFAVFMKDNNELIPMEHGGPRLVIPSLFGWKSCKWVSKIEFTTDFREGYWERIGCHPRGRVAFDERWANAQAGLVWTILSKMSMISLNLLGDKYIPYFQSSGLMLATFVKSLKSLLPSG